MENNTKTGAELIAAERRRQIDVEGWQPETDAKYTDSELLKAAVCYVADTPKPFGQFLWPWDRCWWKPSGRRVRDLVKAGALIAAEIDRLQRHEASLPHHTELRGIFNRKDTETIWCAMCGKYTDHQSGACPELKTEAV